LKGILETFCRVKNKISIETIFDCQIRMIRGFERERERKGVVKINEI